MNIKIMAGLDCLILIHVVAVVSVVHGQTTIDPYENWLNGVIKDSNAQQNPCNSWLCYNGGVCRSVAGSGSAWCTCQSGYTGLHCENTDHPCEGYCYNGGTCQQIFDFSYCECPIGFLGSRCERSDRLGPIPSQPPNPGWNNDWNDIGNVDQWKIPTINPDIWGDHDNDDTMEYIDDNGMAWIAPTTVVAILVLASLYGVVHYLVRQRRRRGVVLIRTVQVCVTDNPPRSMPPSLRPGAYPGLSRGPIRCLSPHIRRGVAIPAEFESEAAQLVSPASSLIDHSVPSDVSSSTQSSTEPAVVTTGAPPPYAEVAPQEGGQSIDEPPPPYPGP